MSSIWQVGDKVKVKEQDILGKVEAVYDGWEIIICEIDGEFECPDSHLSYKPYELEIA
jgi:hypothetical protein